MDLTELVAYVALVMDDAERRFGADHYSAWHDVTTREAPRDMWLSRPGLSVSVANQVVRWARSELGRRRPLDDHTERRGAWAAR